MTKIRLLKRFDLSDIAKKLLKIESIRDGIVKINENFDGHHIPIFLKVYRIEGIPDYKHIAPEEQDLWDDRIRSLVEKLPTQVVLSYKSVNINTKVNFWNINRSILEKNFPSFSSLAKMNGYDKNKLFELFDDLEDFTREHVFKPRQLEVRREYYLTVPYFRFAPFKGVLNMDKINEIEKKIQEFCESNNLETYTDQLYNESQGKIHNFKEETKMRDFFDETDKVVKTYLPKAKELTDQELSTLYYSRYFHNVYTEINEEMLYLSIHEIIQIASEFRKEFAFLHNFYPFKKEIKPNYANYNNRFYSIISVFRSADYLTNNQLQFISELEGDIDFQISFTPIEKEELLKDLNTEINRLGKEIEQRQMEDDEDENLIMINNREKLRRNYIEMQKTEMIKFRAYVVVREKTLKGLNEKTTEVINKILSRGFWAKRISSGNLEEDLRTVSYTGVDCGKSGWRTTTESISRALNFMHLDFDLHSAQGMVTDLDKIEEQLDLQEEVREEREKQNDRSK